MSVEHGITNKNDRDIPLSAKNMKSLCEHNTNSENSLSISINYISKTYYSIFIILC